MPTADSTCWTVLQDAAKGVDTARANFATRYTPLVRAYLAARWRGSAHIRDVEDATQDVFVECLRQGGALEKADPGRTGGFRAFLYGIVRNVALRAEREYARRRDRAGLDEHALGLADDGSLSQVFDKEWAHSLMREAARRQAERAATMGANAQRRVELLNLRFHEGLPIREIAKRWDNSPVALHHEYARARLEFKAALMDVLSFYHPGDPVAAERECNALCDVLG